MSASLGTIELRPSSELMLALDAIFRATDRLASAIEASNRIAGPVATDQQGPADTSLPSADAAKAPINALAMTVMDKLVADRAPMSGTVNPRHVKFSPERNDIIRREWPNGTSIADILSMVHALPGPPIDGRRLGIHAAGILRVKRPATKMPTAAVAAAKSPPSVDLSRLSTLGVVVERKAVAAVVAPEAASRPQHSAPQPKSRVEALVAVSRAISEKPPADPGEPIFASFEVVRRWADERGLSFATWDDLPAVNTKRERFDLPRFKREFPVRGTFG